MYLQCISDLPSTDDEFFKKASTYKLKQKNIYLTAKSQKYGARLQNIKICLALQICSKIYSSKF